MSENSTSEIDNEEILYRIPPEFDVVPAPDEIIFSDGSRHITITGDSTPLVKQVLPDLQSGCSLETISNVAEIDMETANALITSLREHSLLHESYHPSEIAIDSSDPERFHYQYWTDPEHASDVDTEYDIPPMIVHSPDDESSKVEDIPLGFTTKSITHDKLGADPDTDVLISVTFGHSPETNRSVEQIATQSCTPVLFVRLFLDRILIGPFYIPDETVSFDTTYRRSKTTVNDPLSESQVESKLENRPQFPLLSEFLSTVGTYITSELRSYLSRSREPRTATGVIDFDMRTLEAEHHMVLRLPDRSPEGFEYA